MRDYQITTVDLTYNDQPSLVILLHKDGTINRQGDGSSFIDNHFIIGMEDGLFEKMIATIDPQFEQYLGVGMDLNDKKGELCKLEITLSDQQTTFKTIIIYGSESLGLPAPINRYVRNIVEITDPWYQEQRRLIKGEDN